MSPFKKVLLALFIFVIIAWYHISSLNLSQCTQATLRIQEKISIVESRMTNTDVAVEVLGIYQNALGLSEKNNIDCLVVEKIGDQILSAYKKGVVDGKKVFISGV